MRPFMLALALTLAACSGNGSDDPADLADGGLGSDAASDGSACVPKTCAQLGAQCGATSDGCGHELDCGTCLYASDACEGNVCVCQPNCYQAECGDDGCGGSCGTCDANESCTASGRCHYDGASSQPPAAWHCNAAYWDAGDGCDCNCGALDPDCGQSGQNLIGCTGLEQPTCDPQGLCTGGGACHAVPGSAYLTHYMTIGSAPAQTGGSVLAGRYEGIDMHSYNPPGGASGFVGGDAVAYEITGTTWKRMRRPVGGYDPVDETFTASISGATVTLTRTCPSALTETFTFTATATQLVLARPDGGGTKVITFAKRW